jgi:hypothetical protein
MRKLINMEITYKYYEKDAGFEELQAKIYNTNNPEQQQPVSAKDIVERFEKEKIDPKTVMYAFADGEAVAYVQARDYPEPKETHLGYPWALPECPEEVQNKLFDDMLSYLKTRDVGFDIRVNVGTRREKNLNFIKGKSSLKEISQNFRRELDVKQISQLSPSEEEYKIRKATTEDVDILVQLIKEDGRYSGQFTNDEDIAKYFSERVLPADHCFLVFKEEKLVMATAPLIAPLPGDTEERLFLRFHSFLPDNETALKPLLITVAKECVSAGMDSKNLSIIEGSGDSQIIKDTLIEFKPVQSEITGLTFAPVD